MSPRERYIIRYGALAGMITGISVSDFRYTGEVDGWVIFGFLALIALNQYFYNRTMKRQSG